MQTAAKAKSFLTIAPLAFQAPLARVDNLAWRTLEVIITSSQFLAALFSAGNKGY